jgi:hypothetical protein
MHAEYTRTTATRSGWGRWLWLLVPEPDAALYVVDSQDDYRRLTDAYPQGWNNPAVKSRDRAPEWHRLSSPDTPIEGVHVTQVAVAKAQKLPPLGVWAVESTLWFAWRFGTQECVGHLQDDWTLAEG